MAVKKKVKKATKAKKVKKAKKVRCIARTKDGKRCKNFAVAGSKYCASHKKKR